MFITYFKLHLIYISGLTSKCSGMDMFTVKSCWLRINSELI